jgi:hypothetical protein
MHIDESITDTSVNLVDEITHRSISTSLVKVWMNDENG